MLQNEFTEGDRMEETHDTISMEVDETLEPRYVGQTWLKVVKTGEEKNERNGE